MGENKSVRLESQQLDAIGAMDDDDVADNESEALRMALNSGLAELGYIHGRATPDSNTNLRAVFRELARVCAYSAIGYGGVAVAFPVTFLTQWVLVLLLFALGFLVLDQVLESYEPDVSRRLFGWARGGEMRADGGGERGR